MIAGLPENEILVCYAEALSSLPVRGLFICLEEPTVVLIGCVVSKKAYRRREERDEDE